MSGFNVYPAEVEQVIAELPGVAEVAVVGVPDPDTGEAVKAYVVPAPGASVGEDEVQAWCRAAAGPVQVPDEGGLRRRATERPGGARSCAASSGRASADRRRAARRRRRHERKLRPRESRGDRTERRALRVSQRHAGGSRRCAVLALVATRKPTNSRATPTTRVTAKAVSAPRRALSVPLPDSDQRAHGDEHVPGDQAAGVAARRHRRATVPTAQEPPHRPDGAGEDHEGGAARADGGEDPGERTEHVAALGQVVGRDRALERSHGHDPGRERRDEGDHRRAGPAPAGAAQQLDRAERQPRHVEDGAEQEEDAEGGAVPAGRGTHPQSWRRPRRTWRARSSTPARDGGVGPASGRASTA